MALRRIKVEGEGSNKICKIFQQHKDLEEANFNNLKSWHATSYIEFREKSSLDPRNIAKVRFRTFNYKTG